MQIEIKKQTTEHIEVKTPSFYERYGLYYAITESSVIIVAQTSIWVNKAESKDRYAKDITDAMTGENITCEEFDYAYCEARKAIDQEFDQITEEELEGVLIDPANKL